MTHQQKWIFVILLVTTIISFSVFIWPNAVGSENLAMIQIFQPDEAAVLPYVFNMIAPAPSIEKALHAFVFYEYYFYGFPYFGFSALLLFPLKWLGELGNLSLVMVILRQFISVLPMLTSLLLLTYMQDGFRTYRSIILFIILLSLPAVVQNNLWWHPDGLTLLFVVLTLFFLKRDNLRFGRNFFFAAVTVGIATAIKLVGAYFFLAVGLILVLGYLQKKVPWKKLIGMALVFILIMSISFVAANPFLLSHWARTAYNNILHKQVFLLSEGYGVVYKTGLTATWPLMKESFGSAIFLLTGLGVTIWGAWRGRQSFYQGLILAWFIPITLQITFVTHFKFQYWIPVALPMLSSLALLLPEKWDFRKSFFRSGFAYMVKKIIPLILLLVVFGQLTLFVIQNSQTYKDSLHRAENNSRIEFYAKVLKVLDPLPDSPHFIYYDYRLYVPETPNWTIETTYELLDYNYIQEKGFDVLILLEQRILDYLNPETIGTNPETFVLNQQFYRDAENEALSGYKLILRDETGLVFVRDYLFQTYIQE